MRQNSIHFIMPSMEGGGAERVVSVLASYFHKSGRKVIIHLFNRNVIEYEMPQEVCIDKTTLREKKGLAKKWYRLTDIRNLMKKYPNDVFISFFSMYNMYTLAAGLGLQTDIIVSERLDPRKSIPNHKVLFWLRNKLYSRAKTIVFQTQDAKEFFPKNVQEKGVIIANPLKNGLPRRYDGERRHEVVTFARLEPQKNYPLLINAFEDFSKKHSDYSLSIYGKGTMEEKLKKMVQEKNLEDKIHFRGFAKNLHDTIRDAMMFVLPSDYEGLSNSMLEAMAIGLPCVCTDCPPGGAKMFISSGENGILVPVRNREAMCKAMCSIAEDRVLCETLSLNAEKLRFELTEEKICSKWDELVN